MQALPFVIFIVYAVVTIYVLTLMSRFVIAHERVADALESVSRNFRKEGDEKKRA